MKLGGKNMHKSKIVNYISGPDPLSLVEWGGGCNWEKFETN